MTKITLATVRKFVNENIKNGTPVYATRLSVFDGMIDMVDKIENPVEYRIDSFEDAEKTIYFTSTAKNYFSSIEDNETVGFTVWNCCGDGVIYVKKREIQIVEKRGRGRPKKIVDPNAVEIVIEKRGRGRPKKVRVNEEIFWKFLPN